MSLTHRILGLLTYSLCVSVLFTSVSLAESPVAQQPASPADAIVGVWKPADMDVSVQITNAGGQYTGVVLKAVNPAMVNTGLLRGIVFDPASNTWRGEIFAMKRGAFVPMQIRMTAPNGFEMVAGSGLMSKTIEWGRLQ